MNVGFFTGARSEYHILKRLLSEVKEHPSFQNRLFVSGLHLLKEFGYTINDIIADDFEIFQKIEIYKDHQEPTYIEFSEEIQKFSKAFSLEKIDLMFIFGDRVEAYAAAIACHFMKIKIAHFGGGTISEGSHDNIYRYNISNLATYHFTTNKMNTERLKSVPIIPSKNVFHVGSLAIESIAQFKKTQTSITDFFKIKKDKYALITFHPATGTDEKYHENIIQIVELVLNKGYDVLITYPNNDTGFQEIISAIESVKNKEGVFVVENLGGNKYYAAMQDSAFLIGNTSSGIIEAPYFNKPVVNVGSRQAGRDTDIGIINVPNDSVRILEVLNEKFDQGWLPIENNQLYGDGITTKKVINILEKIKDNL